MQQEAEELAVKINDVYGDIVEYKFIDVRTSEIQNYPEVLKKLDRVRLPLTVINGKLRFYGGLDEDLIIDAVKEELIKQNNNNKERGRQRFTGTRT